MRDILSGKGFKVDTASNYDTAVEKLTRFSFRAMVTDMKMPGRSGLELLEYSRENFPEMPIIMLTAFGTIQNAVEALKKGAYDYISKPVQIEELTIILEEILQSRSYSFLRSNYEEEQKKAGEGAIVVAGEVYSPLKMLHIFLGPVESTYLLTDDEPRALALMALHEENQLDAVRQMVIAGVPVVMAMDNLDEVMKQTHDRFIVTGGITAIETSTLKTRKEIFSFTRELFKRMKPFRNRFIYSASCNTAIDTKWETIRDFRDAWQEYAGI